MTGQMPERVWLRHPDIADPFHCPADAIEAWMARGWTPCEEEPQEANPAVAESIEWQRQQAEAAEKAAAAEHTKTKKQRAATSADSTDNEGVNDIG